ncbi:vegetative cell wall gp1 [Chlorella sorokiniana]|uniref:Vegetative cell wall gp1 n=1 Tax=Chlorella sorokiniana TaxID=3076 RepID=A0A2P6TMY5_CHLSO|nr:vegetative cell wall gp1 [Chlorella sorokiniana]|eukprot:PRW45675.1 vegetative cell wall gp1 [Chlorella sorokiniana]
MTSLTSPPKLAVFGALIFALAGAIFAVGGLASLQADTPDQVESQFKPYHYCWFLGVLELFSIGLGIFAVVKDYHRLQAPVIGFLAVATSTILPLISQHIYNTAQLPGSNGSALRGNITIAGLLWAVIGNFFVLLATAYHNLSAPEPALHGASAYPGRNGSDGGSSGQLKNLDAVGPRTDACLDLRRGLQAAGALYRPPCSVYAAPMLGLVQYSDSEDEREEPQPAGDRQQQAAAAPAAAPRQQQVAAPPAPASGLPSAADLFGGGGTQVARSGSAQNVGGAKPSTAAGGLLLPPQLRGRSNVATEDLSTMFTKSAVQRAQQRRSSGGGGGSGGGGDS